MEADIGLEVPEPDWEPRRVRFWWFSKPTLLGLAVGDRIRLFDLYPAEVQALVDALRFSDCHPSYRAPTPDQPHAGGWYNHPHVCRPGETIWAGYGWHGSFWDVNYLGFNFDLSQPEADELIAEYQRVMAEVVPCRWQSAGF